MKDLKNKELFGIKLGEGCKMDQNSWKDYFDIVQDYDDEQCLLRFKETFSNDFYDNGTEIQYNFYLEVYDGNVYNDAGVWCTIYLVPKLEHVYEKHYKNLLDNYNDIPENEWIERDLIYEAICPILIREEIKNIKFTVGDVQIQLDDQYEDAYEEYNKEFEKWEKEILNKRKE